MKLDTRGEFAKAYRRYAQPIYRFMYWQTRDPVLSEDLTSAVFERSWRARASFNGGSRQAWLYRIARNLLTDHWRKKKELLLDDIPGLADQLTAQPMGYEAHSYDFDNEQRVRQLGTALDRLPSNLKAVVVLRFIEELSAREVAEILETTEGNVRVLQLRALRKMRGWMEDESTR